MDTRQGMPVAKRSTVKNAPPPEAVAPSPAAKSAAKGSRVEAKVASRPEARQQDSEEDDPVAAEIGPSR